MTMEGRTVVDGSEEHGKWVKLSRGAGRVLAMAGRPLMVIDGSKGA